MVSELLNSLNYKIGHNGKKKKKTLVLAVGKRFDTLPINDRVNHRFKKCYLQFACSSFTTSADQNVRSSVENWGIPKRLLIMY